MDGATKRRFEELEATIALVAEANGMMQQECAGRCRKDTWWKVDKYDDDNEPVEAHCAVCGCRYHHVFYRGWLTG